AIKPANILVSSGNLQLSDPKICRLKKIADSKEEIRFSAPEILKGASATIESDLYSVGALVYLWLVGQHPFDDSEINHLKLKYMWASPQPIADAASTVHGLSEATIDLLH